ncbi:uncharacterized protein [Parasteatoda tepidariorum]|uniref:uncharacterized protein n=1 Tax=Parasteatoda tepidariorum TaxID=114398 RepID=UPI00077F83D6|nr:uncharacterized protein LOC107441559 [Parasteatoda tepidariorum]
MDELATNSYIKSSTSSDNEGNLSPVSSSDNQEYTKEDDYRIACSNSRSLDLITQTVTSHFTQFANSLDLGEELSQFTSRGLEIFKDTIQENVTVNCLPYVGDKNLLSVADSEVLTNETKEALLSNLSKKVQDVCAKRKRFPKEYSRIYKMRLHHECHNVKKATVIHKVNLPLVSRESFPVDKLSPEKLENTTGQMKSIQKKLLDTMNELKEMKKSIEYAQSLAVNQDSLYDTGYIST